MRAKTALYTAAIALVVVVGYDAYKAKASR